MNHKDPRMTFPPVSLMNIKARPEKQGRALQPYYCICIPHNRRRIGWRIYCLISAAWLLAAADLLTQRHMEWVGERSGGRSSCWWTFLTIGFSPGLEPDQDFYLHSSTSGLRFLFLFSQSFLEVQPRRSARLFFQSFWDLEWFAPRSPREINTLINVILGRLMSLPSPTCSLGTAQQNKNKKKKKRAESDNWTSADWICFFLMSAPLMRSIGLD